MNKILKYPIMEHGVTTLHVPGGRKVLTAAEQGGRIMVWVQVNDRPGEEEVQFKIHAIWTGNDSFSGSGLEYLSTIVGNPFVVHVYYEK